MISNTDLNLQLIPFKNINKRIIKKYHMFSQDNKIIKHKICNIFAPFGREADYNKFNSGQQRFNICFSLNDIKNEIISYKQFIELINSYENYFKQFDELQDYELISNIINRDTYGIVIRCHLKTLKNNTTTPLIQLDQITSTQVEWIQFDKNLQFNMEFNFDCLWIDNTNKKFGISIQVLSVFQTIV